MTSQPFILGTAQLGLDYGIANRAGQPPQAEAFAVLDAAFAAGIATFDTASAYGTSEAVIGAWLRDRQCAPTIITKVPPLAGAGLSAARLALAESLDRLGVRAVDALLLHRSDDWSVPGLADLLDAQREAGVAGRIGMSIYSASEVPDDDRIDVVQLPANAFVQAEARSTAIERILARGGAVHIRSVFAQGLLLMPPAEIPPGLRELAPIVARFQSLAAEARISPAALAIAAAKRLLPGAGLVLGAETARQVADLAAAARQTVEDALADTALAFGRETPAALFDPRRWAHGQTGKRPRSGAA